MAAVGDAGFVIAAEEDAFAGAATGLEPGGDLLGDAEGGGGGGRRGRRRSRRGGVFAEAGDGGLGIGVGEKGAVGGKKGAEAGGELVEVALDAEGVGGGIGNQVDAGGAGDEGDAERVFFAAAEVEKDGFDVFAGAEAVDAKIGAGAGEAARGEVANFDLVAEAAGRVDGEVGKNGMRGIEVFDAGFFLFGAKAAFQEFVLVGGAPVGGGRELGGGGFFRAASGGGHGGERTGPHQGRGRGAGRDEREAAGLSANATEGGGEDDEARAGLYGVSETFSVSGSEIWSRPESVRPEASGRRK